MRVESPRHITHARAEEHRAEPRSAAKQAADAFHSAALPPFASYYPESRHVPTLAKGATVATFNEAQVQALHRVYWSVPPTATMSDVVHAVFADKAFSGLKPGPRTEKQFGMIFADLPKSFPWGWRSRALAATSHLLVDALLTAPKGTPLKPITEALNKRYPGFPSGAAWVHTSSGQWLAEPERFPFITKLPKVGKLRALEGQGDEVVRKDGLGRFVSNEALARKVRELSLDPRVPWNATDDEVAKLIDKELGGDGAFTERSIKLMRASFPKIVPSASAIHAASAGRLAENIRSIHDNEGVTSAQQMFDLVKQRFNVEMTHATLGWLRKSHRELVPNFREESAEPVYADARKLVDAILKHPKEEYLQVGAKLGFSAERTRQLVTIGHRRWPDEFPIIPEQRYTDDDRAMLKKAYATRELGETAREMFARLRVEQPQLQERFQYSSAEAFGNALRMQLDVPPLIQTRIHEYLAALADVAKRSAPGTTLREMVELLQDEHRGAYTEKYVFRLISRARAHPSEFPELAKVADKGGQYPWEKAQVSPTEELAKRVGEAIRGHPGKSHRQIAMALMRDKAFAHQYPTFRYGHIHQLRAKFPKLVPYIDDLQVAGQEPRLKAFHAQLKKIGDRIVAEVRTVDEPEGLTVAELGRRLKLKPYRVLSAIRFEPGRFPWYQERPSGQVDLFLATRVAHEMSHLPIGATLDDVLAGLEKDPKFRERYPAFGYPTFQTLRERYPDIVPQWSTRHQVLRSKLLVDALHAAPKGTPFAKVAAQLDRLYPGQFEGRWANEAFVRALWASDPELYAFTTKPTAEDAEDLATRLAKLERIPERLPLLDKLGPLANKEYFANFEVLAVQHMLGSQVALFDAFRKLGLKPDRSAIVAIPYSASEPVVETLQDKGWDVRVPPLDLEAWYGMVRTALAERIEAAKKTGRKVLVLDDGGLTAMLFEKDPELAKDKNLVKIVEQTRRGITVADGSTLGSPVIDVAQSWGKYVEGPMIGSSLQSKLVSRLEAVGLKSLKGKHVGVVGYGTIGAPLAHFLKSAGAHVTVLDAGEAAMKQAAHDGFAVAKARAAFFGAQDVIVGATGQRSMTAEDLSNLKDGAIIGSGSSKLVEIDVEALVAMAKAKGGKVEVVDAKSHPPTVRYTAKGGKSVTLLAKGFPLNFDGSVEDIEPERIQLTRGLMLIGALQAAGMSSAGVHRLDPDLQLKLLDAFERVGARNIGHEVVEALDLAKDNLGFLKRKHGDLEHDRRHRDA